MLILSMTEKKQLTNASLYQIKNIYFFLFARKESIKKNIERHQYTEIKHTNKMCPYFRN